VLFLCHDIVMRALGWESSLGSAVVFIVGLFLFPIIFALAPVYALIAWGDWLPLVVVCGGNVLFVAILSVLSSQAAEPDEPETGAPTHEKGRWKVWGLSLLMAVLALFAVRTCRLRSTPPADVGTEVQKAWPDADFRERCVEQLRQSPGASLCSRGMAELYADFVVRNLPLLCERYVGKPVDQVKPRELQVARMRCGLDVSAKGTEILARIDPDLTEEAALILLAEMPEDMFEVGLKGVRERRELSLEENRRFSQQFDELVESLDAADRQVLKEFYNKALALGLDALQKELDTATEVSIGDGAPARVAPRARP